MKDEESLEGYAWLVFEGDEYLEPSLQWRAFSLPVRLPLNAHPTESCAIDTGKRFSLRLGRCFCFLASIIPLENFQSK